MWIYERRVKIFFDITAIYVMIKKENRILSRLAEILLRVAVNWQYLRNSNMTKIVNL